MFPRTRFPALYGSGGSLLPFRPLDTGESPVPLKSLNSRGSSCPRVSLESFPSRRPGGSSWSWHTCRETIVNIIFNWCCHVRGGEWWIQDALLEFSHFLISEKISSSSPKLRRLLKSYACTLYMTSLYIHFRMVIFFSGKWFAGHTNDGVWQDGARRLRIAPKT